MPGYSFNWQVDYALFIIYLSLGIPVSFKRLSTQSPCVAEERFIYAVNEYRVRIVLNIEHKSDGLKYATRKQWSGAESQLKMGNINLKRYLITPIT